MFTSKDYNSADGMQTSVFGPIAWTFLHTISFNYPIHPSDKDKQDYKQYILSLGKVLPCKYCRDNFAKNLAMTNFNDKVFDNRETLSRFIYELHNNVNKMLGKPINLTYEQVRDRYEFLRARCVNDVPLLPKYEKGCSEPLYGTKIKSVIDIVPRDSSTESFKIDKKCKLSRTPLASSSGGRTTRRSNSRNKSSSKKTRRSRSKQKTKK